jgi:hypothetical protein
VSRRVRVVEVSLTVILGTAYGGSRREDNCWGASGNLASLVGREVADVFSTRHPEGPPKWWGQALTIIHITLYPNCCF